MVKATAMANLEGLHGDTPGKDVGLQRVLVQRTAHLAELPLSNHLPENDQPAIELPPVRLK
jgi:hypothetical protein